MALQPKPPIQVRGIPTIFGEPFEKNITFCIDTSGSMYKGLDVVKEHLLETLMKLSRKNVPTSFNVIEFNSEVTQWADKMVKCTPETVAVAADWIKKLSAKTGTNTQDALLTALGDSGCEAVYIVTDGLPDQHPMDILDTVGYASRGRPIHCIYLVTEDATDSVSSEFLEDLAVESYGSFHVVTLTTHGCVERITPIYRADHASEKIIRTVNGTMHNSMKTCTVGTTLKLDPEETMYLTPRASLLNSYPYMYPPWSPLQYFWWLQPYRYYYPHGWSRYRTSRGWLKAHEQMIESVENDLSPTAGALLIGKKVLARRLEDGYFYMGTVQSQLLADKFLVAFGPCKHGKYKETTYQDTFVYDIVGVDDARLHTILTHDKVLAPWEPEGERYGPGIVIEGHEKRMADGPEDEIITVTFSNGKTASVPADTAVWVPVQVYERLALELKMPKEARETLQSQQGYPKETLEGYPTSGPEARPEEYELPRQSFAFDSDPLLVETRPWQYPPAPAFDVIPTPYDRHVAFKPKTAVRSEDINKLVPGTGMTYQDLTDKVTSQLVEHKLLLDERETEKEYQERVERERRQKELETEIEKGRQKRRELELEREKRQESDIELALERQKERLRALEKAREEEQARLLKLEQEQQYELEKIKKLEDQKWRDEQRFVEIERERQAEIQQKIDEKLRSEQEQSALEREKEAEEEKWREEERLAEIDRERLLRKREKQEENLLKKSVSFQDNLQVEDLEQTSDSGIQTGSNSREVSGSWNYGYDDYAYDDMILRRRNRYAHLSHGKPRRARSARPPWKKYWGNDPAPPLVEPNSYGPFRETALQTPLEARDSTYPYSVEWTSPMYKYVDPFAKHDYSTSVEMLLKTPKPPSGSKHRYEGGEEVSRVVGSQQMTDEAKEEARRDYKRQKAIQRRINWENRLRHEDQMKLVMQDQHRERILAQMDRDRQRQEKEQDMIRKSREAKKHISAELRAKIENEQQKEKERQEKRLEAMRLRREQREAEAARKAEKLEELNEKRQQYKMAHSQARWDQTQQRLESEDVENNKIASQKREAKINRIGHFRKLEEVGQRKKDLRIGVTHQHLALYRSQVLP